MEATQQTVSQAGAPTTPPDVERSPPGPNSAPLVPDDVGVPTAILEAARQATERTEGLIEHWLNWQCRMIAGIIGGAVFAPGPGKEGVTSLAAWPATPPAALLEQVASRVAASGEGVTLPRQQYTDQAGRICDVLGVPVKTEGHITSIICVMLATRSPPQQRAVLQLIEWGAHWLNHLVQEQSTALREDERLVLELTGRAALAGGSREFARTVTTQLAQEFGCERVSLATCQRLNVTLLHVTGTEQFDRRRQFATYIEAAMQEAADQNQTLRLPVETSGTAVTRAHEKLLRQHSRNSICSVPLSDCRGITGVLSLEAGGTQTITKSMQTRCEAIAAILGPMLGLHVLNERSFASRLGDAMLDRARALLGPARLRTRLVLGASAIALIASALVPGTHRVKAPAALEATARLAVVAPADGFIREAHVRAGDAVQAGALLAALDDQQLKLEQDKWQSERAKQAASYQQALGTRDRPAVTRLLAGLAQIDAELAMVKGRLTRTRLLAPIAGMVVSGDLSQSLDAPVKIGNVLFEIAPLDSYRIVLEVDEHQVNNLQVGQTGRLILAALPGKPLDLLVQRIIPVASSADNRTWFRVEASVRDPLPALRPGMRGVAKVTVGQRSLLWIWTHALTNRIRLALWSMGF